MKGIQDTRSSTLRQLLGNGLTYTISKFQRDYSWTLEQWDDLWQDVQQVLKGVEPAHYLGYLVLQSENDKDFTVIDGQQRITTLSVLILAVLKMLDHLVSAEINADDNTKRGETLRNTFIGHLDPVTLITKSKLTLNKNNDAFYRNYLIPLRDFPKRGLNNSEKSLKHCFEWFYEQLQSTYTTGKALAAFVDQLSDRLFFTVIAVSDELNAFRVFETLNARGVQLSAADLL